MRIIGGLFKSRKIHSPKGVSTRPTSSRLREAVFNICQHFIEGANFLDLFAGSGVMGFEALSRGARSVTFVEKSPEQIQSIKRTLKEFKLGDKGVVYKEDVFKALHRLTQPYEIIYADPPYGKLKDGSDSLALALLQEIDQGNLLKKGGILFLEESSAIGISHVETQHLVHVNSRKVGITRLHQYHLA